MCLFVFVYMCVCVFVCTSARATLNPQTRLFCRSFIDFCPIIRFFVLLYDSINLVQFYIKII